MANQEIIILPNHIIINLISWPGIFPVCALNAQLRDKINCAYRWLAINKLRSVYLRLKRSLK